MGAPKSSHPAHDGDIESTAELPVLGEDLSSTDTWVVPSQIAEGAAEGGGTSAVLEARIGALQSDLESARERRGALELSLRELSQNLTDVEGRLARKGEHLATLERDLAAARVARSSAEAASVADAAELQSLREVRGHLDGELAQVKRELAARTLASAALEARGAELAAEADRLRQDSRALRESLAERDVALAEKSSALATRERRLAELEPQSRERGQRLDQFERERTDLAAQLARAQAEIERLAGVTSAHEASLTELNAQLESQGREASGERRERLELESRHGQVEAALQSTEGQLRERIAALAELERRVAEQDAASARREIEIEDLRAVVASLRENAGSRSTIRGVYEALLNEAERWAGDGEGRVVALQGELRVLEQRAEGLNQQIEHGARLHAEAVAARDAALATIRERDAELDGRALIATRQLADLQSLTDVDARRVGELEALAAQLAASRELAAQHERELANSGVARDAMRSTVESLEVTLEHRKSQLEALEGEITRRDEVIVALQRELEGLRSSADVQRDSVSRQDARLEELDRLLLTAHSRDSDHEASMKAAMELQDELERQLAERGEQLATLMAEIDRQRTQGAAFEERVLEEGARVHAHEERVRALEQRERELLEELADRLVLVDGSRDESMRLRERLAETEQDLRAAEEQINRLEAEQRGRQGRLDELTSAAEESRIALLAATRALAERDELIARLGDAAEKSVEVVDHIRESMQRFDPVTATGSQVAPDGLARLLIRSEGSSEVMHVLGRKTTIGRTPDNDLQINAKYVSRHHAVILSGPTLTIIEDLGSTNGIYVNGRRVTREALSDGDDVMIGKARFRYSIKPVGERDFG